MDIIKLLPIHKVNGKFSTIHGQLRFITRQTYPKVICSQTS